MLVVSTLPATVLNFFSLFRCQYNLHRPNSSHMPYAHVTHTPYSRAAYIYVMLRVAMLLAAQHTHTACHSFGHKLHRWSWSFYRFQFNQDQLRFSIAYYLQRLKSLLTVFCTTELWNTCICVSYRIWYVKSRCPFFFFLSILICVSRSFSFLSVDNGRHAFIWSDHWELVCKNSRNISV